MQAQGQLPDVSACACVSTGCLTLSLTHRFTLTRSLFSFGWKGIHQGTTSPWRSRGGADANHSTHIEKPKQQNTNINQQQQVVMIKIIRKKKQQISSRSAIVPRKEEEQQQGEGGF